MGRLSKLYEAIETLRKEGVSTDDLEAKVNQAEEEIIKKEILPIVTKSIAPALREVQRELVLVVDYMPNEDISVHLSRKRDFTANMKDTKEIKLDDAVEHGTHNATGQLHKKHATDLSVIFPDGAIISDPIAAETLYKVIQKIGATRVRKIVEEQNLVFCKVPVISNRKDTKYGTSQKDLGNGWLLITHSNNKMKKKFLEKISDALQLNLKIIIQS